MLRASARAGRTTSGSVYLRLGALKLAALLMCSALPLCVDAKDQKKDAKTLETITVKGTPQPSRGRFASRSGLFSIRDITGSIGGGLRIATTSTADEKDPDPNSCEKDATAGNPVVIATGNKIEPELDFGSSGEAALSLSRTYNHYWAGAGLFGRHWVSNLDYMLTFGSTALNTC